MRLTPRLRSAALAAPLAVVLGCGADGLTGPLNTLSPEDAVDAFDALTIVSDIGFGGGAALRADAGLRAVTDGVTLASFTIELNESEPCPLGGTTTLKGSITINDETYAGSADIRQDYSNCRVQSSTGRQWTFNGNPNVRTQVTVNEAGSGSGTMTGGFGYSSDGASGRCTISLAITFTETGGSVVGTACGQPINEVFDSGDAVVRVPDQG